MKDWMLSLALVALTVAFFGFLTLAFYTDYQKNHQPCRDGYIKHDGLCLVGYRS